MSTTGRTELFTYMAAALSTAIGIFVVQQLYASYIDQSYHAELKQKGAVESVIAMKKGWADKLDAGKIPIEQAKALLATKGRTGFGSVAPVQSDDLSPVSGWIRMHDFKPAIAHPIRAPRAPEAVVPAAPVVEVAPEPAPVAPASKKAAARPAIKVVPK